jgi:hypothetical protein
VLDEEYHVPVYEPFRAPVDLTNWGQVVQDFLVSLIPNAKSSREPLNEGYLIVTVVVDSHHQITNVPQFEVDLGKLLSSTFTTPRVVIDTVWSDQELTVDTVQILQETQVLVGFSLTGLSLMTLLPKNAHVLQLRPLHDNDHNNNSGEEPGCDLEKFAPWAHMKASRMHCGMHAYKLEKTSTKLTPNPKKVAFLIARALAEDGPCYPAEFQSPHTELDHKTLAIIVPFRDSEDPSSQGAARTQQLRKFVPYMHQFLLEAGREFMIVIAEQSHGVVFNKGATFNAGFAAVSHLVDYVVMHDLDQIPTSSKNTYAFPEEGPTHLCARSTQFPNGKAYGSMVGGALMVTVEQYEKFNGYSNDYWGWGLEDDDMYNRLVGMGMKIIRPPGDIGQYVDIPHPRVMDLDVTPLYKRSRQVHTRNSKGKQFLKDGLEQCEYSLTTDLTEVAVLQRRTLKFHVTLEFDYMPKNLSDTANAPDIK